VGINGPAGNLTSTFDITQAYAQYATGPLTLIAGKFTTLHGTEVIASTGNTNISRSILFGSVPFTHTGVRGTWALGDTINLIAGVNNGWDQLTDSNRAMTVELGATFNPIKPLNIAVSAYSGKETVPFATPGSPDGTRTSVNAVVSYAITDPLSVGLELLGVSQDNFTSLVDGSTIKAKYSGVAGYVTYMFTPKFRGVVRAESFDDKDGLRFGFPAGTTSSTKYSEVTVTAAYLPADNFELRGEVRADKATNAVFTDFNGATNKSLMTFALQGLYKF
jgi:hypothetical protein